MQSVQSTSRTRPHGTPFVHVVALIVPRTLACMECYIFQRLKFSHSCLTSLASWNWNIFKLETIKSQQVLQLSSWLDFGGFHSPNCGDPSNPVNFGQWPFALFQVQNNGVLKRSSASSLARKPARNHRPPKHDSWPFLRQNDGCVWEINQWF